MPPKHLEPASVERAFRHYRAGELARARALAERVLAAAPDDADAHDLLGLVALDQGRLSDAVRCHERAVALEPHDVLYRCNLGVAYAKARAFAQAAITLREVLQVQPTLTEAAVHLGVVLLELGEVDEAVTHLDQLAEQALQSPGSADALAPALANVFARLSRAQAERGQHAQAVTSARRAVALAPSEPTPRRLLAAALLGLGDLEDGLKVLERVCAMAPTLASAHSSLIFHAAFSPTRSGAWQLEETRRWNRLHAAPLAVPHHAHPNARDPQRRLRVGYVSPDLRDHVQRLYLLPVLRHHDRQAFEVVAYASVEKPDRWTEALRAHVDLWRDVAQLDDAALAAAIRSDGIDVLVDLSMHMAGNRLLTFARRPAPVQLSWLAYPGSTGLDGIHYRLTDPFLEPVDQPLPSRDQPLWLPETFWCYDPQSDATVGRLPALSAGHVTFGCLNNFLKVNPAMLGLWARVLARVPGSRLLLLAPSTWARDFVRAVLNDAGISQERVAFVGMQSREDYLATYNGIDVCLDCVPYNGHTTSLDAFWMGVPVVSLVGSTIVGRAGLSQAKNLGLDDLLIAFTEEEFVDKAVELTRDLARLAGLRQQLRDRLSRSPLMDAPGFTRALEGVMRDAWRRHCAR